MTHLNPVVCSAYGFQRSMFMSTSTPMTGALIIAVNLDDTTPPPRCPDARELRWPRPPLRCLLLLLLSISITRHWWHCVFAEKLACAGGVFAYCHWPRIRTRSSRPGRVLPVQQHVDVAARVDCDSTLVACRGACVASCSCGCGRRCTAESERLRDACRRAAQQVQAARALAVSFSAP